MELTIPVQKLEKPLAAKEEFLENPAHNFATEPEERDGKCPPPMQRSVRLYTLEDMIRHYSFRVWA